MRSRSADYLFAASATDARALWVNPAGLAASLEASVMAEIAVERPVDGGLRWAQWAAALNSRGFSLGYQRDRFEDGPSTGTLRFGLALPFPRGAVGAAFSFYSGNAIDTTNNLKVILHHDHVTGSDACRATTRNKLVKMARLPGGSRRYTHCRRAARL